MLVCQKALMLSICGLTILLGCNNAGESAPNDTVLSGLYNLTQYDGQMLPADLGAIIPPGPGVSEPTDCDFLVTMGSLMLNMTAMTFSYSYDLRESCDNQLLSVNETYGKVAFIGKHSLKLTTRFDDPADYQRVAVVDSRLITVKEISGDGQIELLFEYRD